MSSIAKQIDGIGCYLIVYFCILALAGVQIVIAYQHIDGTQMFVRMLLIAIVQAGLALMLFMHLAWERRALMLSLAVVLILIVGMMNMFWSDSFRLINLRPFTN